MKNLFIASLLLFAGYTFAQPQDCEKFKEGNFMILDGDSDTTFIERKGMRQVEYHQGTGLKVAFWVEWLNDCTYYLTIAEIIENPNDLEMIKGALPRVEIVEVKTNSYIQRYSFQGQPEYRDNEVYIVNE